MSLTSDRTIEFGVTCPFIQWNPIFNLVRSIACSVLIETLWSLQITWTGIKSLICLNSGKIRLFTLELLALECQTKPIFNFVRSVAWVMFIQSLWNFYCNLKFPLTCNGKNESWHLLLSIWRYFGKRFSRNVWWVVLYQTYCCCPNPSISLIVMTTEILNLQKNILKNPLLRRYKSDKAETLQKCSWH